MPDKASTINVLSGYGGDVYQQAVEPFYSALYGLEDDEDIALDINSRLDICALQFVYLPEINRQLDAFRMGWNGHNLRTEHSKTPQQLWLDGMLASANSSHTAT